MSSRSHSLSACLSICMSLGGFTGAHAARLEDQTGQQTARDLTERYQQTPTQCGNASRAAFLCGGIILRALPAAAPMPFWSVSNSLGKDASERFSFLRRDTRLSPLANTADNGFILYMPYGEPVDKVMSAVTCANVADDPVHSSCAANVQDTNPKAAVAFNALIHEPATGAKPVEVDVQNFLQKSPGELPIEALFYREGGLAKAQKNQQDFYVDTHIVLPIIAVVLPSDTQNATFSYSAEQQQVNAVGRAVDWDH